MAQSAGHRAQGKNEIYISQSLEEGSFLIYTKT
jgi:hypothetical protein